MMVLTNPFLPAAGALDPPLGWVMTYREQISYQGPSGVVTVLAQARAEQQAERERVGLVFQQGRAEAISEELFAAFLRRRGSELAEQYPDCQLARGVCESGRWARLRERWQMTRAEYDDLYLRLPVLTSLGEWQIVMSRACDSDGRMLAQSNGEWLSRWAAHRRHVRFVSGEISQSDTASLRASGYTPDQTRRCWVSPVLYSHRQIVRFALEAHLPVPLSIIDADPVLRDYAARLKTGIASA